MAYNAGKNSYTVVCQEKKFYHQRFRKSKILTQTKCEVHFCPCSQRFSKNLYLLTNLF